MPQIQLLIQTLKTLLKSKGLTYAKLALALDLSEASVKRMFMEKNFSLMRLAQICDILGIDFAELLQEMNKRKQHVDALSFEQEQMIADDLPLLLITVCALNHWPYEEIKANFDLTDSLLFTKLNQLDQIGLIELLPFNRLRLRISSNFQWLPNGPIQQFFQQRIAADYFATRFKQQDEKLIVLNGMLSEHANAQFQQKLSRLAQEFDLLNSEDSNKPFNQRHGYTCVLSLRAWKYGLFSHLSKS